MNERTLLFYFFVGFALAGPLVVLWNHATRWGDKAFREVLYAAEDCDHAL